MELLATTTTKTFQQPIVGEEAKIQVSVSKTGTQVTGNASFQIGAESMHVSTANFEQYHVNGLIVGGEILAHVGAMKQSLIEGSAL